MYVRNEVTLKHVLTFLQIYFAGNASDLEINVLDFTPDPHTLTITFTDVDGSESSTQFNFTGQTREGESES